MAMAYLEPDVTMGDEAHSDEGSNEEVASTDAGQHEVHEAAAEKKHYEARAWGDIEWLEQISRHLSHVERRLMHAELLSHEVVRLIVEVFLSFSPPP